MPQPLLRIIGPKKWPNFGPTPDAMTEHPALAVLIMQVIAIWSRIDADLEALVLERLMQTDFLLVSGMLDGVRGSEARRGAVRGAATAGYRWRIRGGLRSRCDRSWPNARTDGRSAATARRSQAEPREPSSPEVGARTGFHHTRQR
jgi:hypothetical protein